MKKLLILIIVCFSYSCAKNDEPTPIIDTVVVPPPPYVNPYGSFTATGETSCGYDAGVFFTYLDWTFWGVYEKHYYVLNHDVVGADHIKEGTLYWEVEDITCTGHKKSGQVQIVAGQKSYINIKF